MFTKIIVIIISQNMYVNHHAAYLTTLHCAICQLYLNNTRKKEFPRDPVVRMLSSNAASMGSIPGLGTKIPYAVWSKKEPPKT